MKKYNTNIYTHIYKKVELEVHLGMRPGASV